jgi:hypothetical protein
MAGYVVNANTVIDNTGNGTIGTANGAFNNIYYKSLYVAPWAGPTNFGYTAGGALVPGYSDTIDRYPFSSTSFTAADVGNLTVGKSDIEGCSSATYGYEAAGLTPTATRVIERWPFALSITNASNIGNLTQQSGSTRGEAVALVGSELYGYGYSGGGETVPGYSNTIDRWPFALSITNAVTVGTLGLSDWTFDGNGASPPSVTNGWMVQVMHTTDVQTFPFAASITNASGVGNLSSSRDANAGVPAGGGYNVIDRFPYSIAIVNLTDVGDLSASRWEGAGSNSTTYGYCNGGITSPTTDTTTVDRFPFALSITNAASVGSLSVARGYAAGASS